MSPIRPSEGIATHGSARRSQGNQKTGEGCQRYRTKDPGGGSLPGPVAPETRKDHRSRRNCNHPSVAHPTQVTTSAQLDGTGWATRYSPGARDRIATRKDRSRRLLARAGGQDWLHEPAEPLLRNNGLHRQGRLRWNIMQVETRFSCTNQADKNKVVAAKDRKPGAKWSRCSSTVRWPSGRSPAKSDPSNPTLGN